MVPPTMRPLAFHTSRASGRRILGRRTVNLRSAPWDHWPFTPAEPQPAQDPTAAKAAGDQRAPSRLSPYPRRWQPNLATPNAAWEATISCYGPQGESNPKDPASWPMAAKDSSLRKDLRNCCAALRPVPPAETEGPNPPQPLSRIRPPPK